MVSFPLSRKGNVFVEDRDIVLWDGVDRLALVIYANSLCLDKLLAALSIYMHRALIRFNSHSRHCLIFQITRVIDDCLLDGLRSSTSTLNAVILRNCIFLRDHILWVGLGKELKHLVVQTDVVALQVGVSLVSL